ncbi:MAG: magnesium chelatase [Acidobacteria bacterium]|nr:MAG: magnesium chelatase [Acidobacteriota bacterium]
MEKPRTLGELKRDPYWRQRVRPDRSVKDEMRENVIRKIRQGDRLFPGIIGYEETVIPHIVNAILSKHDMVFLGLRGQAKSRLLRQLVQFLDEEIPAIEGCEINDNPLAPICRSCRLRLEQMGDDIPIAYLRREHRYVEKLATPDVTIADLIGDIDPIKAAKGGHLLSDELTIHYGLLPRANRGIFAINELPDLAAKIQVGLFNILQEGDIQIKGYPIRLPLDVVIVFTANPEDYTARGKIITPLKDRIGSEIRTHYPLSLELGVAITEQEAWLDRDPALPLNIPSFIKQVIEQIAFQARQDQRIDKLSGVSQRLPITCLENTVSNAERRALLAGENQVIPRISDIYAALPAITGKIELEYEGEQRGAENVARDLIRQSVGEIFDRYFDHVDFQSIIQWFDGGGTLKLSDTLAGPASVKELGKIPGLLNHLPALGIEPTADPGLVAAAGEFILEGLYARRKISRSEERGYEKMERPAWRDEDLEDWPGRRRRLN